RRCPADGAGRSGSHGPLPRCPRHHQDAGQRRFVTSAPFGGCHRRGAVGVLRGGCVRTTGEVIHDGVLPYRARLMADRPGGDPGEADDERAAGPAAPVRAAPRRRLLLPAARHGAGGLLPPPSPAVAPPRTARAALGVGGPGSRPARLAAVRPPGGARAGLGRLRRRSGRATVREDRAGDGVPLVPAAPALAPDPAGDAPPVQRDPPGVLNGRNGSAAGAPPHSL